MENGKPWNGFYNRKNKDVVNLYMLSLFKEFFFIEFYWEKNHLITHSILYVFIFILSNLK